MKTKVFICSLKKTGRLHLVNILKREFSLQKKSYLVKPNLFTIKTALEGATTDPQLILFVAKTLKEVGATPIVGECPAMASYARPDIVFDGLGIRKLCQENDIELRVLDRDKPIRVEVSKGVVLKELWLPETIFKVDGIINLPKLKTHQLTTLTCAVKNLFGLQQGGSKANHHRRVANDPEAFAHLLLDIYTVTKPHVKFNIVDAMIAMEGEGPTTGDPVNMNLIIAGEDAAAVDYVCAALAGWDPLTVPTIRLAAERGLGPKSLNEIEIIGIPIEEARHPLRKPSTSLELEQFHRIKMRIAPNSEKCQQCGICQKVCPVGAITLTGVPEIDYARCIQCFCCTELCPYGALKAIRPEERNHG